MLDFVSNDLGKSTRNIGRDGEKAAYSSMGWSLYDDKGRRKYLVPLERKAFLQAALNIGGPTASFCAVLVFSGARLSEVLALTPDRIDDNNCSLNFETLKRNRKGQPKRVVIRAVPVPQKLLYLLDGVHRYRAAQGDQSRAHARLWWFSRTTAWRRVKLVMRKAANPEFVSKPKSLRHAFGAEASMNVSLTMVQKWLGHANIATTTIYTTLVGKEERALAKRTWRDLDARL